jgi:hypothetical protein
MTILTRCFDTLCEDDETCEGYALIKMVPPTGYNGIILDTVTKKAYPNNLVIKAPIDSVTGCWTSCDLPFSDKLSPKSHYEIVEVIKGDSLDNCICTGGCNCYKLIDPALPSTKVWLSSTAGLATTVDVSDVASNMDTPELCAYLSEVYGACLPQTVGFTLSTETMTEAVQTPLDPWYAFMDGFVDFDLAGVQLGADLHDGPLTYEIVDQDGNVVFTDTLATGENMKTITLTPVAVNTGEWFAVRIATPIPATTPARLFIQARFLVSQ